jgi:phosphate transport system permease protein
MVVAVPIGLGSAIYLSEYAPARVRAIVKPTLEVLAGIPSVVLGFFALSVIAPSIVQRFTDAGLFSLASAGIAVGILSVPLVASVSEDALRSVPHALREASYGMGAKKITTVTKVVLPAAVSGLVAAFILAVSRAIGETMVVFIAGGAAGNQAFETSPLEPGLTMTAAMATQAQGTDRVVGEALTFQSLYFVGALLFCITLLLNLIAGRFVRRVRQAY